MKPSARHLALIISVSICIFVVIIFLYRTIMDEGSSFYYIMSIDRSFYSSDRTNAFIYASLPTESLIKIIDRNSDWQNYPRDSIARNLRSGKRTAALAALACKNDKRAIAKLTEVLKQRPEEWSVINYIGKSRNVAMTKFLCDMLSQREDVDTDYPYSQTDKILIATLIELDDPLALDCFETIWEKDRFKHEKEKIEKTIKRWQGIKSGTVKQVAPFEVDATIYSWKGRELLEVSSFGGYKFTIDDKWKRSLQQRLNGTTDQFELSRYYRSFLGFSDGYIELKLKVTELSADKAAALEKTIAKQSAPFKNLPTINGNPYMVSVSQTEGGHYFAYAVMKVGDLEVSAEMKSESHYWFMYNANEIIAIFKSFTRGLDPNKKFSIFY